MASTCRCIDCGITLHETGPSRCYECVRLKSDRAFQTADWLNGLATQIHDLAVEKGWWDEELPTAVYLALIHSEVSEALEALRRPDLLTICDVCNGEIRYGTGPISGVRPSKKIECEKCNSTGTPPGGSRFAEELADVIIRCLDLAAALEIDINRAIREKYAYNKTRAHKHGKLF